MKRLIILTLLLSPFALHSLKELDRAPAYRVPLRPRVSSTLDQPAEATPQWVDIRGYPKATPKRARDEAARALNEAVELWVKNLGLPTRWHPDAQLIQTMVESSPIESSNREYGTVFVQPLRLDTSDLQRDRLFQNYEREIAGRRMFQLGSVVSFALLCLALITSYIRADEATKGYYTTALRVATTATALGAGALLLRALS